MSVEGGSPMKLEGDRFTGFEHHVWMNRKTAIVSKIPSQLGQLWQDMSPKAVEKDLDIFDEYDIPIVDTRLYGPQTVEFKEEADETRRVARYVLKQPLISPSHAMTYADLLHTKAHREKLLELVEQREEIKDKYGLGVDLLGGQGFQLVRPAIDPRIRTMRADVGNLLVAEEDIETNGSWAKHAVKANGFVAKKGEALLCDTRLMPIGGVRSCRDKALAPLMRRNEQFQDAALRATLQGLDVKHPVCDDKWFNNGFKRFVRKLTLHATPKMKREAEKMN